MAKAPATQRSLHPTDFQVAAARSRPLSRAYVFMGPAMAVVILPLSWYLPFSLPALILTLAVSWLFHTMCLRFVTGSVGKSWLQVTHTGALAGTCWGLWNFRGEPLAQLAVSFAFYLAATIVERLTVSKGRVRNSMTAQNAILVITIASWVLVLEAGSFPSWSTMSFRSLFLGPLVWLVVQHQATIAGWDRSLMVVAAVAVGQYGIGMFDLGAMLSMSSVTYVAVLAVVAFALMIVIAVVMTSRSRPSAGETDREV